VRLLRVMRSVYRKLAPPVRLMSSCCACCVWRAEGRSSFLGRGVGGWVVAAFSLFCVCWQGRYASSSPATAIAHLHASPWPPRLPVLSRAPCIHPTPSSSYRGAHAHPHTVNSCAHEQTLMPSYKIFQSHWDSKHSGACPSEDDIKVGARVLSCVCVCVCMCVWVPCVFVSPPVMMIILFIDGMTTQTQKSKP
jgi:hypothetical protein